MNEQFTYDPEDLESLLIHKSFEDLYPEEKLFVLKHMESQEEYESMRETLHTIQGTSEGDSNLSMPSSTKETLMDAFKEEHHKGAWFTLNGLFALLLPPQKPWYGKPAFQLATVGLLLFVGTTFFTVFAPQENLQIAEAHTGEEEVKMAPKESEIIQEEEQEKVEPASAEVSTLKMEEETIQDKSPRSEDEETEMEEEFNSEIKNGDTQFKSTEEVRFDQTTADVALDALENQGPTPTVSPSTTITIEDENLAEATTTFSSGNAPTSADFSPQIDEFIVSAEKSGALNDLEITPVATAGDLSDVMTLLEAAY